MPENYNELPAGRINKIEQNKHSHKTCKTVKSIKDSIMDFACLIFDIKF